MGQSTPSACLPCGRWWRLPLLLGLVLTAILLASRGGLRQVAEPLEGDSGLLAEEQPGQFVTLSIDFGNERQRQLGPIGWWEGMTAYDLLRDAAGDELRLRVQGHGATAFLVAIGDTSNEGAGGKNWTYRVNGQQADRSFAVYELRPGDHVLWSFAAER